MPSNFSVTLPEASSGPPADPGARLEGRKGKWRASVRSPTTTQKKRALSCLSGNKMKQTKQNINKGTRMERFATVTFLGWFSFF